MKSKFCVKTARVAFVLSALLSLTAAGCSSNTPSNVADYKAAAMGANLTPQEKANYDQQAAKARSGSAAAMSQIKPGTGAPPHSSP